MNKKMIICDIDGTLLDCHLGHPYMTDYTLNTLKQLKANGHLLVLATGRCEAYLHDQLKDLQPDAIITVNGGQIKCGDYYIHQELMTNHEIMDMVDYCEANHIEWVIEGEDTCVCDPKQEELYAFFDQFQVPHKNIYPTLPKDYAICKLAMIAKTREAADAFFDRYKEKYSLMRHPSKRSYDIYGKHISKAKAIEKVLDYYHVHIEDTIAFGDGFNDSEMLEYVGLGIAMENASDALKQKANLICGKALEDGVAKQLIQLGLIAPSIKEVDLDEPIMEQLLQLSIEWQQEDISYGYRKNEIEDIEGKRIFVASIHQEIMGYLLGHLTSKTQDTSIIKKDIPYFEIDELYISKHHRSKGIGKQLMQYVEDQLKNENVSQIQLVTSTKNYKAILHFYIEELGMEFWSARLYKNI